MFDKQKYLDICEVIREDLKTVESCLRELFPDDKNLYSEISNFIMSPSKRIRAVLCLLYLRACGFEIDSKIYELILIVELIHNASLIHDDVIDNDCVRREEKTLNAKFGNKIAVISGDYILSIVMQKLTNFAEIELFKIFSETIRAMCEGEIIQYKNLGIVPAMEVYLDKTYKKTGVLFEAVLVAGMFLKNRKLDNNAREFGKNFGIAFQISDDIKNLQTGTKDIDDGIYNAPVILSENRNNITSGIEKTKVLLNNYLGAARQCIEILEESVYKSKILELLDLFNEYGNNKK